MDRAPMVAEVLDAHVLTAVQQQDDLQHDSLQRWAPRRPQYAWGSASDVVRRLEPPVRVREFCSRSQKSAPLSTPTPTPGVSKRIDLSQF
jgi:hypothetical protein